MRLQRSTQTLSLIPVISTPVIIALVTHSSCSLQLRFYTNQQRLAPGCKNNILTLDL
ncbi:hypothetical protein HanXRQr2_Chr07g0297751 [Helianthus annuus]|uniref:Uncharacterized protein n=1 Tax=Helianthus annuus TaxID=4232 RepID=A0A9K3ILZ6_HELAN|nr:hypothetical protein HanXRQr2_Chr07g0297751 [Helianthus annuus]